tara:strand:- start:19141 stop:19266 length:126 start_codon:yes stop_codon:yes gene_type:complete
MTLQEIFTNLSLPEILMFGLGGAIVAMYGMSKLHKDENIDD